MEDTPRLEGRAERIFRFLLLALLWGIWLGIRLAWSLALWPLSRAARRRVGMLLAWLLLLGAMALGPHLVAFAWNRAMLMDAVEIAALQSEGKDPDDILLELRSRAFRLGFTDVLEQPEAFRIETTREEGGNACSIGVDFQQRLSLYGWLSPPVSVRGRVKKWVLAAPSGPHSGEWVE